MTNSRKLWLVLCVVFACLLPLSLFLWLLGEPVVAQVLPRPAIVPNHAVSYSDWKGFGGVAWEWCVATESGRIVWMSANHGRSAHVDLALKPSCPRLPQSKAPFRGVARVSFWSGDRTIGFLPAEPTFEGSGAGLPCGYVVTRAELLAYSQVVDEARLATSNLQQRTVLDALRRQLDWTRGDALTTDASGLGGCTNGPRWRSTEP